MTTRRSALAGLAALAAKPLFAQTPKPQPQLANAAANPLDDQTIVVDVTRVNVLYTVTDRKGRFITDLEKTDFEVREGKREQEILEFARETDLPLRLAVLIDSSNSIRGSFRFLQDAALQFVQSVVRQGQDRATVLSFDTVPQFVTDLTDNMPTLEKGIRGLRPGGGTALYDAIALSCEEKLIQDQPRHKFRRALILLSDGEDTLSHNSRDQALEMAHKADAVIFAISTNVTRMPSDGDKVLKYLAAETGGTTFFPFKVEDLTQSFENIANEMRHQYSVLYSPNPLRADGLYHEVEVRMKAKKDFIVRARKGYYAPKF
jgi:Ca-activated chloride channel homolog